MPPHAQGPSSIAHLDFDDEATVVPLQPAEPAAQALEGSRPVRRQGRRRKARAVVAALSALFATTTSSPGLAGGDAVPPAPKSRRGMPAPVTLAEIATPPQAAGERAAGLREQIRKTAEAELAAIDWSGHSIRKRYKLSASVTKLDRKREGALSMATCTVTAAIRDAERGTLLAIVEGRARAEAQGSDAPTLESDALEGAVRGAITRLPATLRKLP